MKKLSKSWTVALCLVALMVEPAAAWNKAGHMLTAAIAYQVLKAEHPETIGKVVALLKEHPHFDERWTPRLATVSESQRDEYLFTLAARWPDDVRGDPDFHMEKWHYINYPFKPEGQPDSVETSPPEWDNILRGYRVNTTRFKHSHDDEERAAALCWLFHLTGDVHQPLHVAALFTTEFRHGDRGGTRFYVRSDETTVSLHKLWDDSVMTSERFRSVHNRAQGFINRPAFKRDQLPELAETDFENWAVVESMKLAREVAYDNGDLNGSREESSAPNLPDGYAKKAAEVAERRVMVAGYRLADTLHRLFDAQ